MDKTASRKARVSFWGAGLTTAGASRIVIHVDIPDERIVSFDRALAQVIKAALEEAHLSQVEVAKRLDIAEVTFSRMLTPNPDVQRKSFFRASQIATIADALGVSAGALMDLAVKRVEESRNRKPAL